MKLGSTVWIEHTDRGDIRYQVKIILEKQPRDHELCKVCGKGHLALMGHIIQKGLLDDKFYAVTACEHCKAVTVFIYHVEARELELPEAVERDQ